MATGDASPKKLKIVGVVPVDPVSLPKINKQWPIPCGYKGQENSAFVSAIGSGTRLIIRPNWKLGAKLTINVNTVAV